jgi:predicted PurR-regulated permease PerM
MSRMPKVAIALRSIIFAVAVVALMAVSEHLTTFIEIVVLSMILAAAMVPGVAYFHGKRHQPRLAAVATVFGLVLLAVIVAGVVVAPVLYQQVHALAKDLPMYSAKLHTTQDWIQGLTDRFPMLPSLDTLAASASENASTWLKGSLGIAGKLVSGLVICVVVLVTAFFILLEGPNLKAGALSLMPPRHRGILGAQIDPIVLKLGGYVQGLAISIIALTIYLLVVLLIFHVPLALVLALLAGFCAIIPLIGGYIGLVPITLVALTVSLPTALGVLVLSYIGVWVVGHVLMPAVLSKSVHLSPLMVMLSLLLGAETMGIFGALTAVPLLAAVQVLIRNLHIEPMEAQYKLTDGRIKCELPLRWSVKLEDA